MSMTARIVQKLLSAVPLKHLGHVHRVGEGETVPAGSISTAVCGYVELLREDARLCAIGPMCPRCLQGLIDENVFLGTELATLSGLLRAGARIYVREFPKATVIRS